MRLVTLILIGPLLAPPIAVGAPQGQLTPEQARAARRSPVVEVFERCRDAVVNLSTTEIVNVRGSGGIDRILEQFFDLPARQGTRRYTRQSVGSGFVIHPDGYIVTNAHVVAPTADCKATFADGREYAAQVVAHDASHDLAVLKIEAEGDLPTLTLGTSSDLMIGETVIAIGNPLGFQHTVTAGVVSATNRDLEFSNDLMLRGLVQTDASINPGNSGGPLLNVLGELIGVNAAVRGDAENIGFAIPVDQLRDILPDLLDVHRRYRIRSGLALSKEREPRVTDVEADSPAARADLAVGDLLLEVDGDIVRESVDFHISLIGKKAGEPLALKVRREGRVLERTLRLAVLPAPNGGQLARDRLGLEVVPLPEDLARRLRLPGDAGVLVARVQPGGPADRVGIAQRDIILSLGRYHVASLDDLGQLLEYAEAAEEMPISVLRVDNFGKSRLYGAIAVR